MLIHQKHVNLDKEVNLTKEKEKNHYASDFQ